MVGYSRFQWDVIYTACEKAMEYNEGATKPMRNLQALALAAKNHSGLIYIDGDSAYALRKYLT